MENLTKEQIAQSVSAAFDSVELINLAVEDVETIERNIEHLRIMMSKDWFVDALTKTQKTAITKIISN
jgi:hypothetical protein